MCMLRMASGENGTYLPTYILRQTFDAVPSAARALPFLAHAVPFPSTIHRTSDLN